MANQHQDWRTTTAKKDSRFFLAILGIIVFALVGAITFKTVGFVVGIIVGAILGFYLGGLIDPLINKPTLFCRTCKQVIDQTVRVGQNHEEVRRLIGDGAKLYVYGQRLCKHCGAPVKNDIYPKPHPKEPPFGKPPVYGGDG